jgi:polyferredoxin
MDHVGKPKGLIRYASENNIAKKEKTTYSFRLKMYTVVLLGLLTFLAILLITRDDVSIRVMRTAGQMYQKQDSAKISNLYNIKLANKTRRIVHLDLRLENVEGEIKLINSINVPKESYFQTSFFVILKPDQIQRRRTKIKIGVYQKNKKIETVTVSFLGPSI